MPEMAASWTPAGNLTSVPLKTNVSSSHSSRLMCRVKAAIGCAPPRVTVEGTIWFTSKPDVPNTLTRMSVGCAVLICRCEWGLIRTGGDTGGAPGWRGCSGERGSRLSGKKASLMPVSLPEPPKAPMPITLWGQRLAGLLLVELREIRDRNSRFGWLLEGRVVARTGQVEVARVVGEEGAERRRAPGTVGMALATW